VQAARGPRAGRGAGGRAGRPSGAAATKNSHLLDAPAYPVLRLDDQHIWKLLLQLLRRVQARDAGADDDDAVVALGAAHRDRCRSRRDRTAPGPSSGCGPRAGGRASASREVVAYG
jgi:hypothetical protein